MAQPPLDENIVDHVEKFITARPAFGFIVMACVAGVVAHIRAYEQAKIELTWRQHVWGLLGRVISSGFMGLITYFTWSATGWTQAWGFVAAGIVGLFATEASVAVFYIGKAKLEKMFLGEKLPNQGPPPNQP